jgi:hypothetical protein
MVVIANEPRHRIGFSHLNRRGTVAAADVRDARAGAKLCLRSPLRKIRSVST